jgi:hypothetical protein
MGDLIAFRATPELKAKLKAEAAELGISVSKLIKLRLVDTELTTSDIAPLMSTPPVHDDTVYFEKVVSPIETCAHPTDKVRNVAKGKRCIACGARKGFTGDWSG